MQTFFDTEPVRPCGKCTACCTVMGVDELEKPMWKRCPDLSPSRGCSRYDTRPDGCRRFDCLWRRGLGSSRARPDKCGVVFVLTDDQFGVVALNDQRQPRAWAKGEASRVIAELNQGGVPVFTASPGKRRALLPEHSGHSDDALAQMKARFMNQKLA